MLPGPGDLSSLVNVAWMQLKAGQLPESGVSLLLLSKALSVVMLLIGFTAKLPQIQALRKSKSAAGLNLLSLELETCGFSVITAYGFLMHLPITAFGEVVLILGQQLVVLSLAYRYSKGTPAWRPAAAFTALAVFAGLASTGFVSQWTVKLLYSLNILNLLGGRLPQIWSNYKNKNTGQLSGAMFRINTTACLIRIFTSWVEGAGATMLRAFTLAGLLHGTTAAQIAYYGGSSSSSRAKGAAKKVD